MPTLIQYGSVEVIEKYHDGDVSSSIKRYTTNTYVTDQEAVLGAFLNLIDQLGEESTSSIQFSCDKSESSGKLRISAVLTTKDLR